MTHPDKRTSDQVQPEAFSQYAKWYNAFNTQKDYSAEIAYLVEAFSRYRSRPATWLDIGCGSGKHVATLAEAGIAAEGVDISVDMLAMARHAYPEMAFHLGSAESFQLNQRFDAISMLFHVASYLTDDGAVEKAMANVAAHLAPDGLFMFDFWHTDGVGREPPAARIREAVVDGQRLFRFTHVQQDAARDIVNIRFEFRRDSPAGPVLHEEHHAMRHFSRAYLQSVLARAGFEIVLCEGWMTGQALKPQDWYGVIFARLHQPRVVEQHS
jgi:SAM-dependent methyltransferase